MVVVAEAKSMPTSSGLSWLMASSVASRWRTRSSPPSWPPLPRYSAVKVKVSTAARVRLPCQVIVPPVSDAPGFWTHSPKITSAGRVSVSRTPTSSIVPSLLTINV